MPNYPNLNLGGKRPVDTYRYLLEQSASIVTDGLGDTINLLGTTASWASSSISSSYSLSSSWAYRSLLAGAAQNATYASIAAFATSALNATSALSATSASWASSSYSASYISTASWAKTSSVVSNGQSGLFPSDDTTVVTAGNNEQVFVFGSQGGSYNLSVIPISASQVTSSLYGTASQAVTSSMLNGGICVSDAYQLNSNIYIVTNTGSYTFSNADNGKIISTTTGSAGTFTIPASLIAGWNVTVFQSGSGQMTFLTASTAIRLFNRQSQNKTAGQYALASLLQVTADTYVLSGDTA